MRQERFETPGQVELVVDNKLGDVRLRTHADANYGSRAQRARRPGR